MVQGDLRREGGIDAGRILSSVKLLKSTDESSGKIIKEGIEFHSRMRLTMVQRRLESELTGGFTR